MEKKLKIALCTLTILLIGIIAFVGIYSNNENVLPNYKLASELAGKRTTYFKVKDKTKEIIVDKDGNQVDKIPEGANEADYSKQNVVLKENEDITKENCQKVKKILEGRLKNLGVEDYSIRQNENTGDIVIELAENMETDTTIQYLLLKGDFEIKDTEEGTLLMDRSDIDSVSIAYGSDETGTVIVYLDIKFNKEGANKLAEMSKNYLDGMMHTHDEEEKTEDNNESSEEDEEGHEHQKTVTISMEGQTFKTTYFGEEMNNGELTISLGSGKTNEEVYEYVKQGQVFVALLNNGQMPLEYTAENSEYISANISKTSLEIAIGVLLAVAIIIIIYLIIRYKINGLIGGMSIIATAGLLLLMIRYTGTTISIGTISAMLILLIIDAYFINKILKAIKENASEENVKYTSYAVYLQNMNIIIVFLIIAVVFTFMPEVQVFSIGMTLFYGIVSLMISNLILMRQMLIAKSEK